MPHIGKVIIINICFLIFISFGIAFSGDNKNPTTTKILFNKLFITNTQNINKLTQAPPVIKENLSGFKILDEFFKAIEVKNFKNAKTLLLYLDINARSWSGISPLYKSVFHNHFDLVNLLLKRGADVIKIKNSLGIDCDFPGGRDARFTDEELNVIVETAHDLGRKVASHAICLKGINAALKAGVDSIEHSSKMNDETIALFKKFDTYLVPTLIANVRFQEVMGAPDNNNVKTFPGHLNHLIKHFDDKLAKAIKAKVKIAFGSDAGWVEHKNAHREFTLLAKAGLTPVEVLKSTTVYSADLLGISDIAGSIAMGKSADIVATSQNPLKNASALTHVKFVMARGQVFKD